MKVKHDTKDLLEFIHRHGRKAMFVDAKGYWLDLSPISTREEFVNISEWPRRDLLQLARTHFGYKG